MSQKIQIVGARIAKIRTMTREEMKINGWSPSISPAFAIELDNGVVLYAASDYEGNEPGAIFGHLGDQTFTVSS